MKYFVGTCFLFLVVFMGYYVDREQFYLFLGCYVVLFLCYFILAKRTEDHKDLMLLTGLGVVSRLVLIPAFPELSDDVYRFFWDGYLWSHGHNPFLSQPESLLGQGVLSDYLEYQIYPFLNSPNYYSIYPPVCQAIFALGAYMFPDNIMAASMVMKGFAVAADIGTIYILLKLLPVENRDPRLMLLYALNPLVILEFAGNLHAEVWMIFFFFAAYLFYKRKKPLLFIGAYFLSITSKLLTLILYPFFFRKLGWRRFLMYGAAIAILVVASFWPFMEGDWWQNYRTSLALYFQTFEFNGSMYYLFRWIGLQWKGYNMIATIGPAMRLIFLFFLFGLYTLQFINNKALFTRILFAFSLFLMFSTVVHPWYMIIMIPVCLFGPYRYPIIWSFLIALTYITYSTLSYQESSWILFVEYGILTLFVLYEFKLIPLPRKWIWAVQDYLSLPNGPL